MIQQNLQNQFGLGAPGGNEVVPSVVTLVTQTEVSDNDPAWSNPSKPVGQFYTEVTPPPPLTHRSRLPAAARRAHTCL